MLFQIEQEVLDLGVKIRGVIIEGVNNLSYSDELLTYLDQHIAQLLIKDKEKVLHNPILSGFYDLHNKVNIPKRKNPPASENLLKTLYKKQEMFKINPVVDIYNLLSMETYLALGAHDIDHVDGNIHLRLTTGKENFIPLGQTEKKEVHQGVYSYIDDQQDILCYLEIRQVDKTKITNQSTNIFYIIQGNEQTSQEYVDKTAQQLIDTTTHFCGGKGRFLNI